MVVGALGGYAQASNELNQGSTSSSLILSNSVFSNYATIRYCSEQGNLKMEHHSSSGELLP
jgi:hypothetical protein